MGIVGVGVEIFRPLNPPRVNDRLWATLMFDEWVKVSLSRHPTISSDNRPGEKRSFIRGEKEG